MPVSSSRPRLRAIHQADRTRVAPAFTAGGSVAPTPGSSARVGFEAIATLALTQAPTGTQSVLRPGQVPAERLHPVVDLSRGFGSLGGLTDPKPAGPRCDDGLARRRTREAEAKGQRLEPVRELDLVPIRSAQE